LALEKKQVTEELAAYKSAFEEKNSLVLSQYNSITWKIGSLFVKPIDFLLKKFSKN
jgi:hypothetical protein